MAMPDPVGPEDPDTSIAQVAALRRSIAEVEAATYRGSDSAGLATATVDGHGMVVDVKLVRTIGNQSELAVGTAIRVAVDQAQQRLSAAYIEAGAATTETDEVHNGQ